MDRRRFLEFLAASPALAANWQAGLKGGFAGSRALLASPPLQQAVVDRTSLAAFSLTELLARKIVQLGVLRSYPFYVSLDDIASEDYLGQVSEGHNALVISAYGSESGSDGALLRAVLARLRTVSPDDYRSVHGQITPKSPRQPERVLPFDLKIPSVQRHLFPVDDLVVATFEQGWSADEDFKWVTSAFEIAERRTASNLIVPCLGRNWRDRHTIDFGKFFGNFLGQVPMGKRPVNVYFSLYTQWPSFELEDATEALNTAWKESGSAGAALGPAGPSAML